MASDASAAGSSAPLSVPDTIEELLDPAWLSAALGIRFPGVEIEAVDEVVVLARIATNVLFRIRCAGAAPEGLPDRLCAKGYFGERGRGARRVSEPETRFYVELAPTLPIRTLDVVYGQFDAVTNHGLLITEDVTARGFTFLDVLSDYTPDQAAASLEQLAKLHASTWRKASLAELPWLASRLEMYSQPSSLVHLTGNFDGPIGAGIPERVRDPGRLARAYEMHAGEVRSASPWSVMHGDAHVGNVVLDTAGLPTFMDWQLVQRGPYFVDVGYHIASALSVEDRRANEQDLVRHYLDRLAASGVDRQDWETAWSSIRRALVHGFFLWGTTQMVNPAITTRVLERIGTAVDDHGSLDRFHG